eukprot:TRINITY_DN12666_c0_g1_i1.p1 TRINITY_DN12666_c0_g1~~TRINITY_DN12666_c0_g1_i1.p1  ORF type:complete len:217 (+),score=44.27 TRINITY_DN12666_c0_g1_i1:75-653(+)
MISNMTSAFSYIESESQAAADALLAYDVDYAILNATHANYNNKPMNVTLEQFNNITNADWSNFVDGVLSGEDYFLVQPNTEYLQWIGSMPETDFKRFLEWKAYTLAVVDDISPCFSMTLEQAGTSTGICWALMYITLNQGLNWNQQDICTALTVNKLQDYVDMIFTDKVISDDLVTDVHTMTNDIHAAFASR